MGLRALFEVLAATVALLLCGCGDDMTDGDGDVDADVDGDGDSDGDSDSDGDGDGDVDGDADADGDPRQLLTWADIEAALVGTFDIPAADEPGTEYRFGYSEAVHVQLSSGNLLVAGHPWFTMQAEVELPATLDGSEATRVSPWHDVTAGLVPTGWEEGAPEYVGGGMLEVGPRVYFTKNQWYNAPGTDWETQGYNETGEAHGLWTVAGDHAHHSRVGGYMSYPPEALVAEGYTYLAGLEGTSGAALGACCA